MVCYQYYSYKNGTDIILRGRGLECFGAIAKACGWTHFAVLFYSVVKLTKLAARCRIHAACVGVA